MYTMVCCRRLTYQGQCSMSGCLDIGLTTSSTAFFFLCNNMGLLVKWFIRLSTLCYDINASLTWHLISSSDFGDTLPSKQHQKWPQLGHKMCLTPHPPSVVSSHGIVCRHTCMQPCWWNVHFHVKTPIWLEHSCTACYSSAYWVAHFHYMPIVGDGI